MQLLKGWKWARGMARACLLCWSLLKSQLLLQSQQTTENSTPQSALIESCLGSEPAQARPPSSALLLVIFQAPKRAHYAWVTSAISSPRFQTPPQSSQTTCSGPQQYPRNLTPSSILVCFSVAVINDTTKSNSRRKGLISASQFTVHHEGNSRQRPWKGCSPWFVCSACPYTTLDHLPRGTTQLGGLSHTKAFIRKMPLRLAHRPL